MKTLLSWARPWIVVLFLLIFFTPLAEVVHSAGQNQPPAAAPEAKVAPAIVIGFIGGAMIHHKVPHTRELAERLKAAYGDQIRTEVGYNGMKARKDAMRAVHNWLDTDGDGNLSDAEKSAARIILYGHSWGGPALIGFANDLKKENIPVLLTITIDAIPKIGQPARVIPSNVAQAINFYQNRGLLHGRATMIAEDPARTKILGNILVPFDPDAAKCADYDFFFRTIDKYHITLECDPKTWTRIEDLVHTALASANPPMQVRASSPTEE